MSELENYLEELNEFIPKEDEIFYKSNEKRRAIERQLQICIENVIDIAYHLVKFLHLGPPQNDENLFDLLQNHLTNISNLKAMKGFRNILVHQYGKINQKRVLQFIRENLSDFRYFINDVNKILKEIKRD
ncbi:MAG: DUF86 domain-containing protein [Candidatus Lokiarchaeota archaeon]|nr:DUF86 domain-containing protein [Candidatus Harpocratesius repetitus]